MKALQALFRDLPADVGVAYVVVLHLAPDQPSAMKEILESVTSMPVLQVQDTPTIQADCVYVIPPDRELVIDGDHLHARPFTSPRGARAPIDMLFRSLAHGRGDGLAVILTGAGSDGAVGLAAVKEAGGVIFVQDPVEAEFPSMPNSAIATGLADFVAPIAAIAHHIAEVARSKEAVGSLDAGGDANELRRITSFLHSRTGHDFSGYKRATVMRRVLRRVQVRKLLTLAEYTDFLQTNPEEASELFRDLLISVTQFFRDPAAFHDLAEKVIPALFDAPDEQGIRCWVAGCATGEEAYTIAILLAEEAERRDVSVPIQIFATDLDQGALATAREGVYPQTIEADLSDERLERFFLDEGSHYRIRQKIREMVLFASHSLLKDPPFLRLDLISCRNLLIYLERSLQTKLGAVFYYALRSQRYLLLGSAETAPPELFTLVNRDARIYRSLPHATRSLPILSPYSRNRPGLPDPATQRGLPRENEDSAASSHLAALEATAPPSILVDETHHIVHMSAGAGKFILHSGGTFSGRLSSVVRPELRLDAGHAVDRAILERQPTLTLPSLVAFEGEKRRVCLNVVPVARGEESAAQALVFFIDGGVVAGDEQGALPPGEGRPEEMLGLLAELKSAKEALARSRGEHDVAIQELRAANEELQSTNEEYRSTAEELETSKEELQSINEELQTVNSELKDKLKSIASAHSDLRNLTAATEIGTLFLGEDLRIRMFTPPIANLFNITDSDVGRPLSDFTSRLQTGTVEHDVRQVLAELVPIESEIRTTDGRLLIMRVRPYRTMENHIEGAVVSFVDVTNLRGAEHREKESQARYQLLFNTIDQGFCAIQMIFDDRGRANDYRFIEVNRTFTKLTGLADAVGRTFREIEPQHDDFSIEKYGRVAATGEPEHFEAFVSSLGRWFEIHCFRFGDPELHQVGVLFHDVTDRRRAEEEREMLAQELSHRVKNSLAVVQGLARQTSRGMTSVEAFRESFLGRLQALAKAHDVLLATQWHSADMKTVVEATLGAYEPEHGNAISIDGPAVQLKPKQALGLALVLHELCTNAVKYGALSTPDGRLDVHWTVIPQEGRNYASLHWQERHGPPINAKPGKGFGTTFIERASRVELHGTLELKFGAEGCEAKVRFPID